MSQSKHWLNECLGDYSPGEGVFKLRATLNWAAALRFEIEAWHGPSPESQLESCRQHFRSQQIKPGPADKIGEAYCALYHALTSACTLVSLDCNDSGQLWMYSSSVVTWYYAHYHALRALVFAGNQNPGETHAHLQKMLDNVPRDRLPHPYNMRAVVGRDDSLDVRFPESPNASPRVRRNSFNESSKMAQELLLEYLDSTVDWTKKQRGVRRKTFNFMDCAIRYRGKANYRDSLLLTYGKQVQKGYLDFLHNLTVSSRFAAICAFAFAERTYGAETTVHFLEDLERNFRGLESGTQDELFWRSFAA